MVGRHPERKYSYTGGVYDINAFLSAKYHYLKADRILELNNLAIKASRDNGDELVTYSAKDLEIKAGSEGSLMIISNGEGKYFVTNNEGVSCVVDPENDTEGDVINLPIYMSKPGTIAMIPQHEVAVSIIEIMNECDSEEEDIKDFIRTFGSRLDSNYGLAIGALTKELGLEVETLEAA
jgi:hypothetical protein